MQIDLQLVQSSLNINRTVNVSTAHALPGVCLCVFQIWTAMIANYQQTWKTGWVPLECAISKYHDSICCWREQAKNSIYSLMTGTFEVSIWRPGSLMMTWHTVTAYSVIATATTYRHSTDNCPNSRLADTDEIGELRTEMTWKRQYTERCLTCPQKWLWEGLLH